VSWLEVVAEGVVLRVLVQPRASRTRVICEHDGRLKIALAAPPVDGEANAALLLFLSERLGLKRAALSLEDGVTSRRKRVLARGTTAAEVTARLSG
jgi:uncharacterized protein